MKLTADYIKRLRRKRIVLISSIIISVLCGFFLIESLNALKTPVSDSGLITKNESYKTASISVPGREIDVNNDYAESKPQEASILHGNESYDMSDLFDLQMLRVKSFGIDFHMDLDFTYR